MVLDRSSKRIVLMVSKEGGVEIEEVAEKHPEKLHKIFINPAVGLQPFEAQRLAFALGLTGDSLKKGVKMMLALYNAFIATDASILEVNPLIVTKSGDLLALDAKMNFDDNALCIATPTSASCAIPRRRSARSRSLEVLAQLHPPRRQHRLHGQRRRPGDGDDGHHQAVGR